MYNGFIYDLKYCSAFNSFSLVKKKRKEKKKKQIKALCLHLFELSATTMSLNSSAVMLFFK